MTPKLLPGIAVAILAWAGHPARAADETLKAGDTVTVAVFGEQSISGTFSINETGAINYPLLGKLTVAGRSPDEVEREIEKRLEADYIRDASVSVDLAGRKALTVQVIGGVLNPGPVEFQAGAPLNLFTAIATAGGVTEDGNANKIQIQRRRGTDSLESLQVSLSAQREFALVEGDTVIVTSLKAERGPAQVVTVLGEVKTPGTIEMPERRDLNLLTAIAMAGGVTELARESKVTVRRGEETILLNLSRMQKGEIEPFEIRPGDTIFVPESIF